MRIENGVLIEVSDSDIKEGKFVIPEGVTKIGFQAFEGCTSLKSIVIPECVTIIGGGAFWGCTSLRSIVIREGLISIGEQAFTRCGITSIIIPKGVTKIENFLFSCCISLRSIVISEGLIAIESNAFKNCTLLSIIHIDADTQEEYERIQKLFPKELQQKIDSWELWQEKIQGVVKKAVLLLSDPHHGDGFFKKHKMPFELTTKILANLVEEYKIPSFMILKALKESGSAKESIPEEGFQFKK